MNYSSINTQKICPLVSLSSGKGGVGKTVGIVHLAMILAKKGLKVLIFDGDLGMANVDVILGLHPKHSLQDIFTTTLSLKDIILEGPFGIKILPSGSGVKELQNLSILEKDYLLDQMKTLEQSFDIILIDTGAGIGENVSILNKISHKNIIITTPEPHAITDAYALIKVLSQEYGKKQFDVIINMVKNNFEAEKIAENLKRVAQTYLNVKLNLLGSIPYDQEIINAIMRREAISDQNIHTVSGQAWKEVTNQLIAELYAHSKVTKNSTLWEQLLNP